uniref:Protein kinase domain-containing protein n=1 Tax=Tetraselmis chuii TaxID=63592 RepID=A0A7S1SQC5_9CHLO|mmetsp:Transcript_22922/g.40796  ORF Transcript_22922/g.40796 Transcript_22922/m.40796 type:complete len:298 (+) Transcript_22922:276-1169(+)
MSDLSRGMSGLSVGSGDMERLRQENRDLKRQLGGGGVKPSLAIPWEDIDLGDQISGGGFSVVYRGYWLRTPVAIKRWFDPEMTDKLLQEFREEVMTLQELSHPNIVQLMGVCSKPPNLAMVTEYLPHSLFHVLHNTNIEVDRKRVISLAKDICCAFIYLHSRSPPVIHRDIKPANFLLDRAWKLKLCDFGLASQNARQAGAGTPAYMAPELLAGTGFNEKVDVYAFGVCLWEMLARLLPFAETPPGQLKEKIIAGGRPEIPLSCPKAMANLIKDCWQQEASLRPSFPKIHNILSDMQ